MMPKGTATPMISPRLVLDESEELKPEGTMELTIDVPPGIKFAELRSLNKEALSA